MYKSNNTTRITTTAGAGNLSSVKGHLDIYNVTLGPYRIINLKKNLLAVTELRVKAGQTKGPAGLIWPTDWLFPTPELWGLFLKYSFKRWGYILANAAVVLLILDITF